MACSGSLDTECCDFCITQGAVLAVCRLYDILGYNMREQVFVHVGCFAKLYWDKKEAYEKLLASCHVQGTGTTWSPIDGDGKY